VYGSGSDREFPGLTGRLGTQRARRPPSRTTVRTSTPWSSRCCLHLLSSDLGVLARMPVAQLDPVHETGARLFKRDRSCWKSGLRSARFTNSHCRRPSAPPRKMAADPVHCGGQTAPVRMSAFLRHISIMHLLSLGYEASGSGLRRLGRSPLCHLTSASVWRSSSTAPCISHVSAVLAASRLQIGLPGAGSPRAGAGKILPRPRRTVGGEKAGRPEPYTGGTGGTGARAPAWTVLQVLVALVLVVSPYRRERATLPWRFIRRAPRLVNDLRPERDSNAGPTA
jgi:hypothetical protein